MWLDILLKALFVYKESIKLKSTLVNVDSCVVWFESMVLFFHFLVFKHVSKLIYCYLFVVDLSNEIISLVSDSINWIYLDFFLFLVFNRS